LHGWAVIAIGSLAFSGALALLLVLSRVPQTQVLLPWSWQSFFYAALVTHVILSFVVWFLAVLGALSVLVLANAAPTTESGAVGAGTGAVRGTVRGTVRGAGLGLPGMISAAVGAVLLLVPTLLNDGEPSLNNYVPILVHPVYYLGLAMVGLGVALPVIRLLLNPSAFRDNSGLGVAVAGLCYLVALACIGLAGVSLPDGIDTHTLNERLFWGGGHVLQFVNTALMLTAWTMIAERTLGKAPLPHRLYTVVMGAMLVFVLPGPVFYALYDILGLAHRLAFTDLLWYGLTTPPVIVGLGLLMLLVRHRGEVIRNSAVLGLALSMMLFVAGGLMGFFLGPSDARTPSHYHASIGGVNLAFMVLFVVVILPALGRALRSRWKVAAPYHLYGWGQLVFSIGMFTAGAAGVPRKTMGAEAQGLDSTLKMIAMTIYGIGGALAVAGGVLFIALVLARLFGRKDTPHA